MTTTTVPLSIDETKPSSRVLRPPGGASSFSLGMGPEPASSNQRHEPPSTAPAEPNTPTTKVETLTQNTPTGSPFPGQGEGGSPVCKQAANSHSRIFGDPDPTGPIHGRSLAKGASSSNPIVGGGPQTTQQKPATPPAGGKVRQPPGGYCHGIF